MKRILPLLLLACALLAACSGAANREYSVETTAQTTAEESASVSSRAGDAPAAVRPVRLKNIRTGEEADLSAEDGALVLQLLDNRGWAGESADCAVDFTITTPDAVYTYHSDCGTAQLEGRSMTFSETARQEFNSILQSYLGLGTENIAVLEAAPAYDWGVTLTAENVTASGLTLRCAQRGGDVAGALTTGPQYTLERKTAAGWKRVEYLPPEYDIGWDDMAYILPLGGETTWDISWEWLYGQLSPGDYRIGKELTHTWGERNCDRQTQYAEFSVSGLCSLPLASADTQSIRCGIQD